MTDQAESNELSVQPLETDDELFTDFVSLDKEEQFYQLLKTVLPQIGTDERKIIVTEILLALKLEGIVGEDLSDKDVELIQTLKETVYLSPERKEEALRLAEVLLSSGQDNGNRS